MFVNNNHASKLQLHSHVSFICNFID